MPPKKKYQTIKRCQSGLLSIAAPLVAAAIPEGNDRPYADQERRAYREQGIDQHVALGQERLLGQTVRGRLVEQEEEGVQAAQRALRVGAVELRLLVAHLLERCDPLVGLGHELVAEPELNRLRRARLRAGRPEAVVDAVVAERALVGPSRVVVERDDAERARADTVPAAVADILVDVHGAELGPVDRAGGARVKAARLGAVLAHVRHEKPGELAIGLRLLDEADEAVGLVGERRVILVGAGPLRLLARQLVPLLARHLAGSATDTQ